MKGVKATAVIPARGGSVGVRRKNLRTVGGVPLVVRSIEAAIGARHVKRVIVSTDDAEIASVARRAGADAHERPPELADDSTTVSDVVFDALDGDHDGYVVVLQPTSPFTDSHLIDATVEHMDDDDVLCDSVETCTAIRHPLYDKNGQMHGVALNRQQMPAVAWLPTGAVKVCSEFPAIGSHEHNWLVSSSHALYDPGEERPDRVVQPLVAERYAVDVDTPADLAHARDLASRGRIVFVVNASRDVGSGHLHRCLTLADELSQHDISFVARDSVDEWGRDLVRERGYEFGGSDGQGYNSPTSVIVFDVPDFSDLSQVLAAQSNGSKVVVLESLNERVVQAADLAVNSLYAGPPSALCGPGWEPLRPEFWTPDGAPDDADRVRCLISFGGTDPSRLTERFALLAARVPGVDPVVLWPPGRGERGTFSGASVEVWDGSVSDALASCHVALTSAGRTVLEAAAMRVATIAVAAHEREEQHAPVPGVMWLGHHAQLSDETLVQALTWLVENADERRARASRAHAAVDPAGAAVRLADLIDRFVRR